MLTCIEIFVSLAGRDLYDFVVWKLAPDQFVAMLPGVLVDEHSQTGVLLQDGLVESGCFLDFDCCHGEGSNLIQLLIDFRLLLAG